MKTERYPVSRFMRRARLAGVALLGILPLSLCADPIYTWVGEASGGNWDNPKNWQVSGTPEADRTPIAIGRGGALFTSTNVDRNVVFTGAKATSVDGKSYANWLRDITIRQPAPAVSQLTISSNLRLGNNLNLSATGGGRTVLQLRNVNDDGNATKSVNFDLGYPNEAVRVLTIGENGTLDFAGTVRSSGNLAGSIGRGNVSLNGGKILLRNAVKGGSEQSVSYALAADLMIRSGDIVFGEKAIDGSKGVEDVRFSARGSLTMTGGRLVNQSSTNERQFWLGGDKNFILNTASIDRGISLVLFSSEDQTLTSGTPLHGVQLRQSSSAVKTIAATVEGQNIGTIRMIQSKDGEVTTLRMGSDLTLRDHAALPQAGQVGVPAGGSTVTYRIDTAGHTLNLLANGSAWKPNTPRNNVNAIWHITGGGVVIANGFDFSATNVTVTVDAGTTLKDASGRVVSIP